MGMSQADLQRMFPQPVEREKGIENNETNKDVLEAAMKLARQVYYQLIAVHGGLTQHNFDTQEDERIADVRKKIFSASRQVRFAHEKLVNVYDEDFPTAKPEDSEQSIGHYS